jgi:hypothetical protein
MHRHSLQQVQIRRAPIGERRPIAENLGNLGVKITDFFEELIDGRRSVFDRAAQPRSFLLVQAFSGINHPNIRPTLVRLIEQIAAEK